jgi:hypothetical protein
VVVETQVEDVVFGEGVRARSGGKARCESSLTTR